ncbi:MAG: glycosyltransferase family 4 protein [Actinomycetota bacterium]|nr:glycosyltransferase family 4 protein [Actinomycetota bacterium]
MKLVVLTPHFAPDVAPTGMVVTRLVEEFVGLGHQIDVVTALPWYREHSVEPGWRGKLVRYEDTSWGRITRVHPFPTPDKRALGRRALAFGAFTALAAREGRRGRPVDGVLAVSPPLTLGLAGARVARARGGRFVFNVQDVFPDVTIELGYLRNPLAIAAAKRMEHYCYGRAEAITVLSEDLRSNLSGKTDPHKIHVVPNFVDSETITPQPAENDYRTEYGLTGKRVVMYAGNVGLSQSLDLMIDAAAALAHETDVVFVINGAGAARDDLKKHARGMDNVVFVDLQPIDRLPEVLAAADIHVVALKKGLAHSSVPSKTYSILAAGRPIVASVDEGSEVARILERAGAGMAVPPEDPEAFTKAIRTLLDDREDAAAMGRAGRAFVEGWASPAAIARRYEELFEHLRQKGVATP